MGKWERIRLTPADVLHIPGLGFDGLVGYSPIAMAKNAIGMVQACEDYGASFFANGAAPGILQAIEIGQRNPRRISSTVFKTPWQKMTYGLSIQATNFGSRAFDKISSFPAIFIADISDVLLVFVKRVRATIVMMESVSEKIDQIFLQVEEEVNSSNSGSEIAALFGFALDQLGDSRNVLSQSARAIEDYNHQQMRS
nr:phage portal protein [Arcanobacterium urinimassiliense]